MKVKYVKHSASQRGLLVIKILVIRKKDSKNRLLSKYHHLNTYASPETLLLEHEKESTHKEGDTSLVYYTP